jgi:hypothetical protein
MAEFKGDDYIFPDEQEDKGKPVDTEVTDEFEVEVEDDTPPEDRNRKPMKEPVDEVTDDELSNYDEKVQARIKKFTRGYHDERRAKEEALRERQAAEEYARQIIEENKRLQQQLSTGSEVYIEQSKQVAEGELTSAERAYREAYDDGDADAMVAAQRKIAQATLKLDKATNMRPLQVQEKEVQIPQRPSVDERAERWRSNNAWFGPNRAMTAFALGLHTELVEDRGINPTSDKYYQTIDNTMRKKFPEHFGSYEDAEVPPQETSEPAYEEDPPRRATKYASVVAPATRSTPPNRIRLKASQAAIARRLGVSLDDYARQVAKLNRGE